jgi:hypothetical protein
MDTVYNVIPVKWGHEYSKVQRLVPPTEEQLAGDTSLEAQVEEVEVDTVVVVDRDGTSLVRLIVGESLSHFLVHYVQFLDVDGRQLLRQALEETSGIIVPEVAPPKMSLIKGGKR